MRFHQDGKVEAYNTNIAEDYTEEGKTTMDVSGLWEPWPEFGDYYGLIKKDRVPVSGIYT